MKSIIKELPTAYPGVLGYTDFTAIYISESLVGKDRELVRKHELSHIWLQHNIRGNEFRKAHQNVSHVLLNVAMDLEIAKHIYDDSDNNIITRPRSVLKGAITTAQCDKYPKCQYFEEFYLELEKQAKKQLKKIYSWDAKHNKLKKGKEGKVSAKSAVAEAKKKAKAHSRSGNVQKIQAKLKEYKIKPSLASEIDAVAGRQKISRIKSYRRPSRIEHQEFFSKGVISRRKTPKMTVYVDRSGSFDSSKTQEATQTLHRILQKYRGQVNHDTIYFNDELHTVDPQVGSGGTNHQLVLDEIAKSNSELSIIITDDDYGVVSEPSNLPKTIVFAVGCDSTVLARKLGLTEVRA